MRILVVVSGAKWLGGLTIQTALLCRELERLGHAVAVVSLGADAAVDQFQHVRIRLGEDDSQWADNVLSGQEYVFRYEVVADAARYLAPGPLPVRSALAPLVRVGMAVVAPPPATGRAPLTQARGAAASFARGLTAALDAGLSGGAAEAPFLSRLLLHTDEEDLRRLEAIREWFGPDVEYCCDLALVPMMAKLSDRGIPLTAAAQGFEVLQRRGVGVLAALKASRHRLDLVLSGSKANVEENLVQFEEFADGEVPVRVIPYGVLLDGGWEMDRAAAVRRLRDLEAYLRPDQRGRGGLWGDWPVSVDTAAPGAPFVITCFSRLDVEKGTDLPLHALSILRHRGIPARLWIAGNAMPGSAYLDVLRQKIRLMDLEHCVSLIGTITEQEDKVALLRASDAFVAGFIRSEPFGMVYTEAFAASLPVVAPDMGAAPELMEAVGETAMLYPANDTGALADRIARLYGEPELRRRLAGLERRAFLEHYNATTMAAAAACEFEEAIKRRSRRLHSDRASLVLPAVPV